MTLSFLDVLQLPVVLFLVGLSGIFLNRKNIIVILMSVELILLAVNLNLITSSVYLDDSIGYVFALFVLTIAASESAIGLAILVIYFRVTKSIQVETIHALKG